ncbi:hypothetical protein G9A89_021683, partial [Geosiphon pyriformis]
NFVFGIQGYVDKTGTDAYQRTAVEPFVFTLTLFTNHIRNSPKYWRVLALLPASLCKKQSKKHTFGASVRNYHIALQHALAEFIDLQKNPPILRLRLGDQCQHVRAHLYWVNTIADGLANEQLIGRIQNRISSPRLSRGCHCPQHLADSIHLSCKFVTQTAIERLTVAALGPSPDNDQHWKEYLGSLESNKEQKAAESALKTRKKMAQGILKNVFGQHVVDLVWFHVDQGPNPRGCFGSTPVDPMHAFEEGIVPNIMSVIIDPMPDSAKASLDALALDIVSCNRWDSEYPRMNFSGGFSSLTQLTADEKIGKMMLLWIIMQTPLGMDIMNKRCNPSFDVQRAASAARFSSSTLDENNNEKYDETESDEASIVGTNTRAYTGTPVQQEIVQNSLKEHGLIFVIPWIKHMHTFHQEILQRTVFQIKTTKGKGHKHVLPTSNFLDRHVVASANDNLYYDEGVHVIRTELEQDKSEAQYSLDCTSEQLKTLLEMLLTFHATYKYGHSSERSCFDKNVRMIMGLIKQWVKRGKGTKNWLISKFHDLLHMPVDTKNFGSLANVDASKGEHGLKTWAKLPSKTVRTRDANLYYRDMATRIYENRLLELAMNTTVPRKALTSSTHNGDNDSVTIELLGPRVQLVLEGPSQLQPELTAFLRSKLHLPFPLELFQEAKYSQNGHAPIVIRGTHNYRNSGPWHDCVLVAYEGNDGNNKNEFPYQVYGFFEDKRNGKKFAVGKMGQTKKTNSRLLDEWTYEKHYRIVDLETTSQAIFALTIPACCYKTGGGKQSYQMYVLKDRITEWPSIFNSYNRNENT